MHRDRTSHPQAVLDHLVGMTESNRAFLQHALESMSHDQQLALAGSVEKLLSAPWVLVRDEVVRLAPDGWPPQGRPEPQLAVMAHVLDELDSRGLLPDAVRRVQTRLTINGGASPEGSTTLVLQDIVDGTGTVAWYWDLDLGYGGSARWAEEWVPGPPVGGLWVSASDDGRRWHELGRTDQERSVLRLQQVRARQLRFGWLEGGWGQGMLVGLGFVYGDRWSRDLARAVDEVLAALQPAVGRLMLMPTG